MSNWKRITLVIFVLIGSVAFFGYWSINQFDQAFNNLNALYVANTYSVYPSSKQNVELASTSQEMFVELATSTDLGLASTSQEMLLIVATSTDPELSFIFPKKSDEVYIGCTYKISWQSSTTINSLETTLVDAGTRESVGPIASGLEKENTIERDLQNLKWKVGVVWSGAYYIKVSKINGVEVEFRSEIFEINKMSENIRSSEKENICKESNGLF